MNQAIDWTTDAFLRHLYEQTGEQRGLKQEGLTLEEHREWLRGKLMQALGKFPERKHPLDPAVLMQADYGDYLLERVAYTTTEAVHVPVIVLIPKGKAGPFPAVLACHGHGNGQWDAAGCDPEGKELENPGIHNRFAVQLVRKGMVVVIPEIMGFGVRRMAGEMTNQPNNNSCGTLSSQLLMYGRTLAGMRVYEAMRALDYMELRPDVDTGRIGIFGFSGGGLIAALTSALADRVQATVLCGWTNTFQGSILAMRHCIDNYLPGILLDAEQPELAGLIAPRALFVESGEQDRIFPVEHVRKAVSSLEKTFAAWGAAGHFAYDIHPGSHEISGRTSVEWLQKQLEL